MTAHIYITITIAISSSNSAEIIGYTTYKLQKAMATPPVHFAVTNTYKRVLSYPLNNPSVTASPCHLPLHKGGFLFCTNHLAIIVLPTINFVATMKI